MSTNIFRGCQIAVFFFVAMLENIHAQSNFNESGNSINRRPSDGIYNSNVNERKAMNHHHIEERDVLWEKRIWREIDVNELQNHHFAFEKKPLASILLEAANKGKLTAYSPADDEFSKCMSTEEISSIIHKKDTIMLNDLDADTLKPVVVYRDFDPKAVVRYRIKEVVYFDSRLGKFNTRILGVAPIMNHYDNDGNFLATAPICWFYYDELRPVLAKEASYGGKTDTNNLTWTDIFDSRVLEGTITKESNVYDARLQDKFSSINKIYEAQKIHENMRNIEEDLSSNH